MSGLIVSLLIFISTASFSALSSIASHVNFSLLAFRSFMYAILLLMEVNKLLLPSYTAAPAVPLLTTIYNFQNNNLKN